MVNTSVDTRDERYPGIKASKVRVFEFLKQYLVESHGDTIFPGDILHEMHAAVVALVIPVLTALLAHAAARMLDSTDFSILPAVFILLFAARRTKNCLIVSPSTAIVAKLCRFPFLPKTLFSRRSLRSDLICTLSTADRCAISSARITAILTQAGVYSGLLRLIVCHVFSIGYSNTDLVSVYSTGCVNCTGKYRNSGRFLFVKYFNQQTRSRVSRSHAFSRNREGIGACPTANTF
jgi:hypothetical protein